MAETTLTPANLQGLQADEQANDPMVGQGNVFSFNAPMPTVASVKTEGYTEYDMAAAQPEDAPQTATLVTPDVAVVEPAAGPEE